MGVVPGHPVEILMRRLQPAAVLAHSVLAADDVVIRHHSRGQRLVKPHLFFLLRLVDVAPTGAPGGPRACHVGRHFALLHGIADPALQRTSPDRRVVSAAALVVALKPLADFSELHQVGRGADAAAEISEVKTGWIFLLGDGIVELPQVDRALVEFVPVGQSPRLRQATALIAIAHWQGAQRRPCVGVQTIHVVQRVDLPHNGRHVIGHICGEHAGAEESGILGVMHGVAFGIALEPLRMGLNRVFPIQVRTHTRDHMYAAFLSGGAAVAEEIALPEELALPVEWHLGLIKRQDPGDAHQNGIHLQAGPVVRPLLDIQDGWVVLGHVGLADAADLPLPWHRRRGCQGRGRQSDARQHDEIPAIQFH